MNIKSNKYEYFEQSGCHMCRHLFKKEEYDEDTEYYCNFESTDRPSCGSCFMRERFTGDESRRKWKEWSDIRRVNPWGICKKFEESD